ncbi:MAG: imelysin family protein [Pseudomonadota bacterium]
MSRGTAWQRLAGALPLALVCLATMLSGLGPARGEPVTSASELAEFVVAAVDRFIVPGYEALAAATDRLEQATGAWCASGEAAAPAAVKAAFRDSVLAFARVEMVRFGPAGRDTRTQRLALWPDQRGVVRRQVQRALATPDRALWSKEAIAIQSAAIQGLPALELLIYPLARTESAAEATHRCRLAAAVAGYVAELARRIRSEWTTADGWRSVMLAAAPDNPVYHSHQEVAADLVRALLTGLQIVREQEIMPRLKAIESAKPASGLPFERSGLSIDYLLAGLAGVRDLQAALALEEVAARLGAREADKAWMRQWLASAYGVLETDAHLAEPKSKAGDKWLADAKALRQAAFYANGLRQLIGREIAPAAGLLIGFNELDGD